MTTAVTVIAPFYYPADTPLAVGATASLPDSLADQMVSAGKARYQTPRTSDQTDLTADEVNLIRGVVSGAWNPLQISAPGGTAAGAVLTATPGSGWTVGGYQWTRDGADISGETSSTYTLTLADEGALIGCRAGSPVYTALIEIPAGAYPVGYLSLDGGVLSLDGGVLSLV